MTGKSGLGDVQLIRRARKRSSGGRLDFFFNDPERETRYVVAVMLGAEVDANLKRARALRQAALAKLFAAR